MSIKTKDASETSGKEKAYELPDGDTITVESERSRRPEALFQSSAVGKQAKRRPWHRNGTTMFSGIGERMTKELTALAPSTMEIKVRVFPSASTP